MLYSAAPGRLTGGGVPDPKRRGVYRREWGRGILCTLRGSGVPQYVFREPDGYQRRPKSCRGAFRTYENNTQNRYKFTGTLTAVNATVSIGWT